jgi:hypothetical protein
MNKSSKTRSLQMDCLEQRALLSTTTGASSVTTLFQQILDRTPSQADVSFWTGVQERFGTAGLVKDLQNSAEHQKLANTPTDPVTPSSSGTSLLSFPSVSGSSLNGTQNVASFVDSLYATLLGRSADPVSAARWVTLIENGTSLNTVVNDFLNSSEYQNLQANLASRIGTDTGVSVGPGQFGNLSNPQNATAFIDSLYAGILHRLPDAAGVSLFVNQLQQGATSNQIITDFLTSAENIQRFASGLSGAGLATTGTGLGTTTGTGLGTTTGTSLGTTLGSGLGTATGTGLGTTTGIGLGTTTGTGLGTTIGTGLGTTTGPGLGTTLGPGLGTTVGFGLGTGTSTGFGLG